MKKMKKVKTVTTVVQDKSEKDGDRDSDKEADRSTGVPSQTVSGSRFSARLTCDEMIKKKHMEEQALRKKFSVLENINGVTVDLTPKLLTIGYERQQLEALSETIRQFNNKFYKSSSFRSLHSGTSSIWRSKSARGVGMRMSMEEIMAGIGSDTVLVDPSRESFISGTDSSSEEDDQQTRLHPKAIRVTLTKTALIPLYERYSMTTIRNTAEGNEVEADNKLYDYLTAGRGRIRRRLEAECQTINKLCKSRETNTDCLIYKSTASYVSFYEMFDTYKDIDSMMDKTSNELDAAEVVIKNQPLNRQFLQIVRSPSFQLASMITERLLAGNEFSAEQKRFRNMMHINRTALDIQYSYKMKSLFSVKLCSNTECERRAVSDISFCYNNSDIFAVAYGIYSYSAAKLPRTGAVAVWSIKNPCSPERYYTYDTPVVSVEFSPYLCTLLAVGLFDGSVEVRDITYRGDTPVAVSQRSTSPCVEPVLAIKWIKQTTDANDVDPFLTLSQDGTVTRYRIINSVYLLGYKQMVLERVEGVPEGLSFKANQEILHQSYRHPQGLNLTKHPLYPDVYYVLTDEGCLHKCSTNYQHQYLELMKTHEGSVNCMEFSPWSPKLFLTCGNDWAIRIWFDGIFKPIITLRNYRKPYHWAGWSRTHSTIIVGINRACIEIWDLKRSTLKPMSCTTTEHSLSTMAKFSRNGSCIAIGNEKADVNMFAFEEMPFPPYFQYDALEKAIYNAAAMSKDLNIEMKNVGYFGYPNKSFVLPV